MTSCAASSVGDRGRVLLGAVGSAIVVLLCFRAGNGVRTSCGCPVPVAVRLIARAVGVVGCGWESLIVGPTGWCRALHPGLCLASAFPLGRQVLPLHRPPVCGSGSQSLFRPPGSGGGRGIQSPLPVRPGWCGWPHCVCSCELAMHAAGMARGAPRGGAVCRSGACPRPGVRPPPAVCPQDGLSGPATDLLWARACRLGGLALSLWLPACPAGGCVPRGWWEAVPGLVAFHRCEGSRVSGAVPLPAARLWGRAGRTLCTGVLITGGVGIGDPAPAPAGRPLGGLSGSATHLLWARVCGQGDPDCPFCLHALRGPRAAGPVRGRPLGGGLPRCEGRLVSGPVPLPAARPCRPAARTRCQCVPGKGGVCMAGPAPAPQRALLRAIVARCGGGGRASPGGVPCAVVRGV